VSTNVAHLNEDVVMDGAAATDGIAAFDLVNGLTVILFLWLQR